LGQDGSRRERGEFSLQISLILNHGQTFFHLPASQGNMFNIMMFSIQDMRVDKVKKPVRILAVNSGTF
jgi:hypothetical protein